MAYARSQRRKFEEAVQSYQDRMERSLGHVVLCAAWRKYCARPSMDPAVAVEIAYVEDLPGYDPGDGIGSLEEIDYKSKMSTPEVVRCTSHAHLASPRTPWEPCIDCSDFPGM